MKTTLLTTLVLSLFANILEAQEKLPLPYVLYGKATVPAENFASLPDREIAAWLLMERQHEAKLAEFALRRAQNPYVKQLAKSIAKDNEAVSGMLRRWASASGNSNATQPAFDGPPQSPWPSIHAQLIERSMATAFENLRSLPDSQFEAAYIKSQLELSRQQIDASKALSTHASPGFRNQLENLREIAWRHSYDATEVMKNISGDSTSLARR